MTQGIYDPREELTHDIQVGQVYGHARSKTTHDDGSVTYEEKLRLVYEDDEKVLLRSNKEYTNVDGHHYVIERRDTFEENAGVGFYTLLEDVEHAPPVSSDGIVGAMKIAKRHKNQYQHKVDCGAGRKAKHKLEAMQDLIDELTAMDPTEIDWTTVPGVGETTAENLRNAGFETDADVLAASDEELLALGGVGQKNLQNILERAGAANERDAIPA